MNQSIPETRTCPEDLESTEPFVFSRDSAIWKYNREWTGLLYGPAAAILQIAHPAIGHAVARHSDFQSDSLGRLRRTLADVNSIAFGTWDEAKETKARLLGIHGKVRGKSQSGVSYDAFDQDLMTWVLATLVVASIEGRQFVYGPMTSKAKQALLGDMVKFGRFFGIRDDERLETWNAFERYYASMIEGDLLGSDPVCGELARLLVRPKDSAMSRLLGLATGFLPIETLPRQLLPSLTLTSTVSSRLAMRVFRRTFPFLFKLLPERARLYERTRRRMSEDHSV